MLERVPLLALFVPLLLTLQTVQQPRTAFSAKVHGRITDADTGKPIPKLRVGLVRKNYSRDGALQPTIYTYVQTDENGTYTSSVELRRERTGFMRGNRLTEIPSLIPST